MSTSPVPAAPAVVLDTNTVLDWLVFADAGVQAVAAAIQAGRLRWVACARMRDEFSRTLSYPAIERWKPDSERMLASFDRWSVQLADPPPAPLDLRCSDTDDQVFLDLALLAGARWLLTHDRALLRLARRAARAGLLIRKPGAWLSP